MRPTLLLLPLLALLPLGACGGESSAPPTITSAYLMGQLAGVLEGVHDEESAKAAQPRLRALLDQWKALAARTAAAGGALQDGAAQVATGLGEGFDEARRRLTRAVLRAALKQEVRDVLGSELGRLEEPPGR